MRTTLEPKFLRALALLAVATATGALAACETQQQRVSKREDDLAAAGFVVKPANTPQRQEMLAKLPPNQILQRVHGDNVHYVYADPLVCKCLYVGTQQDYSNLKQHEQQQHIADEQLETAQTYSDPAWSWGAWGPWGPGFGFAYGPYGW